MHPLIAAIIGFFVAVPVNLLADYLPMRRYLEEAHRNPFTNHAALPPMPRFLPHAPFYLWSGLINLLLRRKTFKPARTFRRVGLELFLPLLYAYCAVNQSFYLFIFCSSGTTLIFVAIIDVEWRQIYPEALWYLVITLFINALIFNYTDYVVAGAIRGLLYGGILWLLGIAFGTLVRLSRRRGVGRTIFGLGDVWLLGACGMCVGADSLVPAILITIASAGIASVVLILSRFRLPKHKRRTQAIPYAPYIVLGSLLMFYAPQWTLNILYRIAG